MDFLRDAPELTGDEPEDTETETPKIYEPIPSFKSLSERLSMFQQQYNDTIRGAPMNLVFFEVSFSQNMCGSYSTPQSEQMLFAWIDLKPFYGLAGCNDPPNEDLKDNPDTSG